MYLGLTFSGLRVVILSDVSVGSHLDSPTSPSPSPSSFFLLLLEPPHMQLFQPPLHASSSPSFSFRGARASRTGGQATSIGLPPSLPPSFLHLSVGYGCSRTPFHVQITYACTPPSPSYPFPILLLLVLLLPCTSLILFAFLCFSLGPSLPLNTYVMCMCFPSFIPTYLLTLLPSLSLFLFVFSFAVSRPCVSMCM